MTPATATIEQIQQHYEAQGKEMHMTTLIAYHNDPSIKTAILAQLAHHREADELIKGQYWEDGKGCAVGCTLHSTNHAEYETRFGIPQMIARLEDCIFEGLPNGKAKAWPERFMNAISPGADLSRVGWQFLHWILTDNTVNPGIDHPIVKDAVKQCADILVPLTKGESISESAESAENAWSAADSADSAYSAAYSAAKSAAKSAENAAKSAYSAAWSAAWSAAYSAAKSAYSAAESAAKSAAESAYSAAKSAAESAAKSAADSAAENADSAAERAYSAAENAAWIKMSNKLIELLEAAS